MQLTVLTKSAMTSTAKLFGYSKIDRPLTAMVNLPTSKWSLVDVTLNVLIFGSVGPHVSSSPSNVTGSVPVLNLSVSDCVGRSDTSSGSLSSIENVLGSLWKRTKGFGGVTVIVLRQGKRLKTPNPL